MLLSIPMADAPISNMRVYRHRDKESIVRPAVIFRVKSVLFVAAELRSERKHLIACCHYYALTEDGEDNFTVNANTITFGKRALREAGDLARLLGIDRIALFTDSQLATTPHVFNASPSPTPGSM